MNLDDKLAFLTSVRFWKFALAIAIFVLMSEGLLPEGSLGTIIEIVGLLSGTSATVGTIDRFAEQM